MAWRELPIPKRIDVKASLSEHTDTAIRYKNVTITENGIETLPYWEAFSAEQMIDNNASTATQWLTGVTVYKAKKGIAYDTDCWLLSNQYGLWLIDNTSVTKLVSLSAPTDTFLIPINHNGNPAFVFGAKDASVKLKLVLVGGVSSPVVVNMFLPSPTYAPAVNSSSVPDRTPILYRYRYTYYDSATQRESPPSPITSCYGDPLNAESASSVERHNNVWGLEDAVSGDKIRIYRWTENVNTWFRIAEITATAGWSYADTYPAGEVFADTLYEVWSLDVVPEAMCYHNERLYVASGSVIYIGDVGRLSFRFGIDEGSDDPTLGGYVRLSGAVTKLISWNTHVLAFTDTGCYRIIEDNGVFFSVPAPFPLPVSRHSVADTTLGIVILTADGVVFVNKEEQQSVFPFNWELFFTRKKRVPLSVRVTKERGKDVIDLEFVEETSVYSGVSYLRFGENITGEHTLGIFWGCR